jgi:transcriptional regulator of arginine metabolism
MKSFRQAAILDIVSREAIHSQEDLRARLRVRGVEATQATLSRDIKELGLVKRASDGSYQQPAALVADPDGPRPPHLRRAVVEYLRGVDRVQQLVILRTGSAQAPALAEAIDTSRAAEVVGTIAGENTILVVTRNARHATAFARRMEQWAKGKEEPVTAEMRKT